VARTAKVGEPIHQILFEKRDYAANIVRRPNHVMLEMILERSRAAGK
jgi:hypothetical protein